MALNSNDWMLAGTSAWLYSVCYILEHRGKWTRPFAMLYRLHNLAWCHWCHSWHPNVTACNAMYMLATSSFNITLQKTRWVSPTQRMLSTKSSGTSPPKWRCNSTVFGGNQIAHCFGGRNPLCYLQCMHDGYHGIVVRCSMIILMHKRGWFKLWCQQLCSNIDFAMSLCHVGTSNVFAINKWFV